MFGKDSDKFKTRFEELFEYIGTSIDEAEEAYNRYLIHKLQSGTKKKVLKEVIKSK